MDKPDFDLTELENFAGGDEILKEIENRIAHLEKEEKGTHEEIEKVSEPDTKFEEGLRNDGVTNGPQEENFADKARPFLLPLFLTLGAIVFSLIFVYFFLNFQPTVTPRAITNVGQTEQVQPPPAKQVIVYDNTPEPTPVVEEVATPTEPVVETPTFENGTNTIINVRFSYNKYTYDTFPDGMYLTGDQIFSGDYDGYKILATNRAYANDYMFGVDRNKVSLIGQCSFTIDNATVAIQNMTDATGDRVYPNVGTKYFRGKVVKVLKSSRPYIDCKQGQNAGADY